MQRCKHVRRKYWRGALATIAAALLAIYSVPAVVSAAGFAPAGEPNSFKSVPTVREWYFEEVRGSSRFDKIGLHHDGAGPKPEENPTMVVLYLPGTNMNGTVAPDDPNYSFQLYLARHAVDVWSLDYRTHFVPPAATQQELAELKGWTADLFESDIDDAANFILAQTHRKNLFLAGFSRGVEFAYLYTALHPDKVEGIIALDGVIPRRPARTPPDGKYADDIGGEHLTYEKRKALLEMVIANPDGPAPIPKYRTASENLAHVVYDAGGFFGGHGGLANPGGGYSDTRVLAPVLLTYDRYWPAIQDYENPFSEERIKALANSHVPVIAFGSTNFGASWPVMVKDSAHSTGSKDATVTSLHGWGHLDVLCGNEAAHTVFARVVEWIKLRSKPPYITGRMLRNREAEHGRNVRSQDPAKKMSASLFVISPAGGDYKEGSRL